MPFNKIMELISKPAVVKDEAPAPIKTVIRKVSNEQIQKGIIQHMELASKKLEAQSPAPMVVSGNDWIVPADFARTLERENIQLKEKTSVCKHNHDASNCMMCAQEGVQLDILAENTRLKEEVDKLRLELDVKAETNITYLKQANRACEEFNKLQSRLTETEKMVVGLREVLNNYNNSENWLQLKCKALSQVPQSLAQKFVKREVLEQMCKPIEASRQLLEYRYNQDQLHLAHICMNDCDEALKIARNELSSTEPRE